MAPGYVISFAAAGVLFTSFVFVQVIKEMPPLDPLKLLMKSYWGSTGWKKPVFTDEENRLLIDAKLSKPSKSMTHDEVVAWALGVCEKVSKKAVANAFLYSLSTRRLEYRSALGSYAHLHRMRKHPFERAENFHGDICKTCGFDEVEGTGIKFSVLSFEKYKWGGVRHDRLTYMAYDLEQFIELEPFPPTSGDYEILSSILKAAEESKNFTTLKKNLSNVIKSNDAERGVLCEILAYAGVFQPDDCPSYIDSFIDWARRGDGQPRSDMRYPLSWWEGNHYVSRAVDYWFPEYKRHA